MDVTILIKSIMKFRYQFKQETGIDPLTRKFTLAGIAMETFCALHLNDHKMGVTPISSYNSRNSSMIGNIWLDWMEHTRQIRLSREYLVFGAYWADAMDVEGRTVYEFLGCFWHGCKDCHPDQDTVNENLGASYKALHDTVDAKHAYYTKHGFRCEFMWECKFKQLKASNPDLQAFYTERMAHYQAAKLAGPVNLRDALKGGRTNNIKFLHQTAPDENIRYLDVCPTQESELSYRTPSGFPQRI